MTSMVRPGLPGAVTCGEDVVSDRGPEGADVARTGDFSTLERPENRSINRIPVRLVVSQKGRSAPLGHTRDISLHGLFIETREPFEVGAVVPLSIEVDPKMPLLAHAEVVRKTADGMGLRFRELTRDASRRLRHWVIDHTSVAGSRRQVEQLIEGSAHIEPIASPERIRGLMSEIRASGARVTLIPVARVARDYAHLVHLDGDRLVFKSEGSSSLSAREDVYALLTLQFVSYSFSLVVAAVDGAVVRCEMPEVVVFSERRIHGRTKAPPGSVIRLPSPGLESGFVELPLIDISDDGLSFRAPMETLMTVGAPLDGAVVDVDGRVSSLDNAEVRNLMRMEDAEGSWLRVGVALGPGRLGRQRGLNARVRAKTPIARFFDRVRTAFSVVLNRGRARIANGGSNSRRVTVRAGGLPIVGILDCTSAEDERISAPLVIVLPGFGGRKEQLSFLAGTIIEGFARQNADIAVLRIDGTNNLGESGKDPDCQGEGMACMHFTLSGLVQDTLATLAWAKNNPFIDPTRIVLVSASVAAIGVRHVMTMPEAGDVCLWFAYMGAADAIDLVKNASGNVDFHAYYVRGEKLGVITLNGVLNDGDYFWRDMLEHKIGYLDTGRAEMAKVRADVVWLRGKHDAFVDPRRVEALMRVPASGAREIIDVDGGHIPRTGDEAIKQFTQVTRRIWRTLHGHEMPPFTPSIGRLQVKAESEWQQTRRAVIADRSEWWRTYLLHNGGIGFDILEYSRDYVEILELQAERALGSLRPHPDRQGPPVVLELGAGTGNLTRRLLERGARVIATDLVADALTLLRDKLSAHRDRLQTEVVDIEGSPLLAIKRWVRGDLPGVMSLAERVPGVQRGMLAELIAHGEDDVHGISSGYEIDIDAFVSRARLGVASARLLKDLNLLARVATGRVERAAARAALTVLPPSLVDGNVGLPSAEGSVDAVAMSFVLSYLTHPEDTLSEVWRVLRPGGVLVVSSVVQDSDSSRMYLDLVTHLENLPEAELPPGSDPAQTRAFLANAARRFLDHAAELYRLEEEGLFRFYSPAALAAAVARRGFIDIQTDRAFGNPPQGVVITCRKP